MASIPTNNMSQTFLCDKIILICQEDADDDFFAAAFARIECHYFVNGGFFDYDGQVIKEASKLQNIPGVIVQGRYDLVSLYFIPIYIFYISLFY